MTDPEIDDVDLSRKQSRRSCGQSSEAPAALAALVTNGLDFA
jgi:hypothetical protein